MSAEVIFHRLVQRDMNAIRRYYSEEGGEPLADRFYFSFINRVEHAAANPKLHHFVHGRLRRVNIKEFPYHFLYRETSRGIRILVLRHDKRHPAFGLSRK